MEKILGLHNITSPKGVTNKSRKRVGRGNGSGHGTFSGKGRKGQTSRTGSGNGLKIFGLRQLIARTPKLRGFKSFKQKPAVFNVSDLNKYFKDGDVVTLNKFIELNLIGRNYKSFKILGLGELKAKLTIEGGKVSSSAKEKIEKAGGSVK